MTPTPSPEELVEPVKYLLEGNHFRVTFLTRPGSGHPGQPDPRTKSDVDPTPVDLLDLLQNNIGQVDGCGVVLRLDDPFQVPQVGLLLRQLGVAVVDDLGRGVVEPRTARRPCGTCAVRRARLCRPPPPYWISAAVYRSANRF